MGSAVVERIAAEPDTGIDADRWNYLLCAWHELDTPEGWRAEIREAGIVLVPPPPAIHNEIPELISRQLVRSMADDVAIHQNTGIAVHRRARLRIPDLVVFPRAAIPAERGVVLDAGEVLLAVEVTSPDNAEDDRGPKRSEYATAGIPLYLLVDGHDPAGRRITCFSRPLGTDYADSHAVAWGEKIELPEPVALGLDTAGFRTFDG